MRRISLISAWSLLSLVAQGCDVDSSSAPLAETGDTLVTPDSSTGGAEIDEGGDAIENPDVSFAIDLGPVSADGTSAGSNPNVGDIPPTIIWASPDDGANLRLGEATTFTATVTDPYISPTELTLQVALEDGPFPEPIDAHADADGHVTFTSTLLPPGDVTVLIRAYDGTNPPASVARTFFVDAPPDAPTVVLAPDAPTGADALTTTVTPATTSRDGQLDPDPEWRYTWLLDGVATEETGATVDASVTTPGQVWTVQVRAAEGDVLGAYGQDSVEIGNSLPTAPAIAVTPAEPSVATRLTCTEITAATDADGQALSPIVAWYRNGEYWEAAGSAVSLELASADFGGYKALLDAHVGDVITCTMQVTDGFDVTDLVESAPVTLGAFDTCGSGLSGCPERSTCTNTETALASCVCEAGTEPIGAFCVDVDECASGSPCGETGDCSNTDGAFTCTCHDGYAMGAAGMCVDVDECATGAAQCDPNATCANTPPGSYSCTCNEGWAGDGVTCVDVDQCILGDVVCSLLADCISEPGPDRCACIEGYEGDGSTCEDADECAAGTDTCSEDAQCVNLEGGFDCACLPGYDGDGFTCTDRDECDTGEAVCDPNAQCMDAQGTYECVCNEGWAGSGKVCTDVDECAFDPSPCEAGASCENQPGSYVCECKPGWTLTAGVCVPAGG